MSKKGLTQKFAETATVRDYHPSNRPGVMGDEESFLIQETNYGNPQSSYMLPKHHPIYRATRPLFGSTSTNTENTPPMTLLKGERRRKMMNVGAQQVYPQEYARLVRQELQRSPVLSAQRDNELRNSAWRTTYKKMKNAIRPVPKVLKGAYMGVPTPEQRQAQAMFSTTLENAAKAGKAAAENAAEIYKTTPNLVPPPEEPPLVSWNAYYPEEDISEEALAEAFGSNRHTPAGAFGGRRSKKKCVQTLKKKLRRRGRGTRRTRRP